MKDVFPSREELLELARCRMPFGKYKDWFLTDLPESYLVWFSRKGYPAGKLGERLRSIYEIKLNGLENLLRDVREGKTGAPPSSPPPAAR